MGLKVKISEAIKAQQDGLAEYEIYLLSTTVSRKKKLAKTAMGDAAAVFFHKKILYTNLCTRIFINYNTLIYNQYY